MVGFIRENTMLICDLIDDLLNIVRKERKIEEFNRVYINFAQLTLILLSKSKKLTTEKYKKYSNLTKFNRL